MSLSSLALEVLFGPAGPPARYWIGLARGGKEILDPGYDRQMVLKTQWKRVQDKATAVVGFGPFENAVEYDTTLLFAEQERIERLPVLGGPVRVPPGAFVEHSVTVAFGVCDGGV